MLSRFKILYDVPIDVGSYIKYKEQIPQRVGFGEVVGIYGNGKNKRYEIINLNKRLKCIVDANHNYKRRTINSKYCKHVDIKSTILQKKNFEIGDIVCHKRLGFKKYGVIISFHHPDEIFSENINITHNGTDLIDCVEIEPRCLMRTRNKNDEVIRFTCKKKHLKLCEVDMWNEKGVIIT